MMVSVVILMMSKTMTRIMIMINIMMMMMMTMKTVSTLCDFLGARGVMMAECLSSVMASRVNTDTDTFKSHDILES